MTKALNSEEADNELSYANAIWQDNACHFVILKNGNNVLCEIHTDHGFSDRPIIALNNWMSQQTKKKSASDM